MPANTTTRQSGQEGTGGETSHSVEVFQCVLCGEWHPDQPTADECCAHLIEDGNATDLDVPPDVFMRFVRLVEDDQDEARPASPSPISIHMTGKGYEYIRDRSCGEDRTAYVHQLVAIADGADPFELFTCRKHVHHRNQVPWDNRPGNLEVLDPQHHNAKHGTA
jgi:hypothetical protein